MMRILVAEDNQCYGLVIAEHLMSLSFAVDLALTAADFRELSGSYSYDLYLIDLNLPDGDGLDLTRELRAKHNTAPIMIMTARSAIKDRVKGLNVGADDYLVKPFNHEELLARVRALLRRPANLLPDIITFGRLTYNSLNGETAWDGKPIRLRPSEQRLLGLLIRQSGRTVTRSLIDNALQSISDERSENAIDQLVSRLRRALKLAGANIVLRSVKGVGYILDKAS